MNRLLTTCLVITLLFVAAGCDSGAEKTVHLNGTTMGTTYSVAWVRSASSNTSIDQTDFDSLLEEINASMSTYIETSVISRINASRDTAARHPIDDHFLTVFERAKVIHEQTGGAFNPAVGPLVLAWGFGPDPPASPDSSQIDSLLKLADFGVFVLKKEDAPMIRKTMPGAELDFSAIAKGYGVDALGELLEQNGIADYFVEIGGEVRARGQKPDGSAWRFGIERPVPGERTVQVVVNLQDAALATSGNYRNFYVRDGRRYVHTINPDTGYPEINSLLSVSVIAGDCMSADAFATAFMVMGLSEARAFVRTTPELEAYFVTDAGDGTLEEIATDGMDLILER